MRDDFNVEEEYGSLLDFLETRIAEVETLAHYGVKGMKWGVRKSDPSTPREPLKSLGPDSVSRKTASGETITLKKIPPNKLNNFLGRVSKKYREGYSKRAELAILDGRGKRVGEASVMKKNNEELYLNWLGIKSSARGKGYATAVMKAGRDFGKQEGFKKMTLEVPGKSPDARHIYEKLGFKVTGQDNGPGTEIWGGLTNMEYTFDKVKHSHTSSSEILHYGVKGMKWGVRKTDPSKDTPNPNYTRGQRGYDRKNFGKGGVKRVNRRLNEGHDLKTARNKEHRRRGRINSAVTAGILGAYYAPRVYRVGKAVGKVAMQAAVYGIAQRAETKRGEAWARNAFAESGGLRGTPKTSKKRRDGSYNISSF